MDIKMIHEMLEKITECAKSEIESKGLSEIDTEEFDKVTDIIKDLSESLYYRTITVAMDEAEYGKDYDWEGRKGYDDWRYKSGRFAPKGRGMRRGYEHTMMSDYDMDSMEHMRDMDRKDGKMYYTEPVRMGDMMYDRDTREGRSGAARKGYMETKELHKMNTPEDKQHKMKELERYMQELSGDITEMIGDASPEEKNLLKAKLQTLTTKIQ